MFPDLGDLLQHFLEEADRADLEALIDTMIARIHLLVAKSQRRTLGHEFGAFLNEALARKEAQRQAYAVLTDREIEVLERMAQGWSNQEIADRLGITERTVRQHQRHMQHKLGVVGRGRLVARVYGLDGLCKVSSETTMP